MLPIPIGANHITGTLYPSLCPIGYDPVLAYDIRRASVLSRRTLPIDLIPCSSGELSIELPQRDLMTASCAAIEAGNKRRTCGTDAVQGNRCGIAASFPEVLAESSPQAAWDATRIIR